MYIVGLNCYHGDSSACLIKDGRLVAAAEEERFRRRKHWAGFPAEAIRYCLSAEKLRLDEIDHAAVNTNAYASLWPKLHYAFTGKANWSLLSEKIQTRRRRQALRDRLKTTFPDQNLKGKIHRVEHHLAHLASSFFVSPFDEAVTVSIDGFGDFSSASWGLGEGSHIHVGGRVSFPHSLGVFYQAMTQYLGFPRYGDEYKVMGLASYSEPRYLEAMRDIIRLNDKGTFSLDLRFFRHQRHEIGYQWVDREPQVSRLFSHEMTRLLGPSRPENSPVEPRHKAIASSVQAVYEEAFFHLLNNIHSQYGTKKLTLAGGCAMNSVANGKIRDKTKFQDIYIQSAAGDAGGAIGAAFVAWHRLNRKDTRFFMEHAYWGPCYSEEDIHHLLNQERNKLLAENCSIEQAEHEDKLCRRVVESIAEGKVVGWFQGRMEWGPRALGNRSILCDPRRADMKDILNDRIKRRESFRPFAPSVLREAVKDWFDVDDDVPFMMKVYPVRAEKRAQIPAVTHIDGSGRLQTVYEHTNPRFYRLIKCFAAKTGIPLLLNTSFNENEPIVCKPKEALDCFLRTNMDMLVLGNFVIYRT
jgi:carbamoyltransferase